MLMETKCEISDIIELVGALKMLLVGKRLSVRTTSEQLSTCRELDNFVSIMTVQWAG
jgi:hypothetical protein